MTDETETAAPAEGAPVDTPAEPTPADRTAALETEVATLKDQLLRTLAEMENLRRRTEREVADTRVYAVSGLAREVLSVGDNLARALGAVSEEARAGADETTRALFEGVEMTERELQKALEKHGVRRIDPTGQRFDPNFHQAIFEVPNTEVPSGTVVQVVQAGYVIGDRVLRPAMVGVGRGGPKPAPSDGAKVDRTV